VETREQSAYLLTQGCAEGQGYLFCPPMAAAEFAPSAPVGTRKKRSPMVSNPPDGGKRPSDAKRSYRTPVCFKDLSPAK
jgi:hypothetical protein